MFTHELQSIDGITVNVLTGIKVPEGSTCTVDKIKRSMSKSPKRLGAKVVTNAKQQTAINVRH